MSRNRCFAFTSYALGDPEKENYLRGQLESLTQVVFCIACRETCPTTGRKHLQGFIQFKNQRLLTAIQKALMCHVEPMKKKSSPFANYEYCMKDGDVWHQFGTVPTPPGETEANVWEMTWEHAKKGEYEMIRPDIRIRYYAILQRIYNEYRIPVPSLVWTPELRVGMWIYGPPASGKTRYTFDEYPNAYRKGKSKWWDWYADQEQVCIQDVTPKFIREFYDMILEWTDLYPFPAEFKNGSFNHGIRPQKVIFTSNFSIEECLEGFTEFQLIAFKRRFEVHEFFVKNH